MVKVDKWLACLSSLMLSLCITCFGGCSESTPPREGDGASHYSKRPPGAPISRPSVEIPRTVPEAVKYVVARLDEETKAELRAIEERHLLGRTHMGLGMWVRNELGLWKGNDELLKATGHWGDPDGASSVIVHAVWKELQRHAPTSVGENRDANHFGG